MAQKNGSFWDNPFGGLFDFNHDGKESLFEQALAFKMFEECKTAATDTAEPKYYASYTKQNLYAWRDTCEDGRMHNIYPNDYETEEEYNDALQEAKYAWRATCEDGGDYEIDPADYETEDEYTDALAAAQEVAESSGITVNFLYSPEDDDEQEPQEADYPNKRRYLAEYALSNHRYSSRGTDWEKRCLASCKFISKKADTVLAANYLSHTSGFLYSQAIKDHFDLPVSLPDEDENQEYEFYNAICKIAKRDVSLSLQIWDWCLEQFAPYVKFDQYAASELTNSIIDHLYNFPDSFCSALARYMEEHSGFAKKLIKTLDEPTNNLAKIIAAAIQSSSLKTAKLLFKEGLKKANGQWKDINDLTDCTIMWCQNDTELESMEYFRDHLLPMVEAIDIGMVQDELDEWKNTIAQYICRVEDNCERYAYTRKNAWRKNVPDGSPYNLNPCSYATEDKYLSALDEAMYGWRKWYRIVNTYDLNPDNFETQDEFQSALSAAREKQQKLEWERKRQIQRQTEAPIDASISTDTEIYHYYGILLPFSSRPYYYRADKSIALKIGDSVYVPLGDDPQGTKGTVVSVGQYARIAVPFPVERTKFILGKATDL